MASDAVCSLRISSATGPTVAVLGRLKSDHQRFGDLAVGEPARQQDRYFPLARRQRIHLGCWRWTLAAKTRTRLRQVELLKRLRGVPCLDCGATFPAFVMEFDHRDARTKRALVTHMPGRASDRRILEEVAKCDIVCSNCHPNRIFARRQQNARE